MIPLFFFPALFLILHIMGVFFGLYVIFPWYDFLIHALVSVSLATLFLFIFPEAKRGVFISVMVIGIIWEFFEPAFGGFGASGFIDTGLDLFADALGAGAFLFHDRIQTQWLNNLRSRFLGEQAR